MNINGQRQMLIMPKIFKTDFFQRIGFLKSRQVKSLIIVFPKNNRNCKLEQRR